MSELVNSANRETAKQDRSGARTASDVIRRIPDLDKIVITAKQIELEGYTTINGGFKIDESGNMTCNDSTMNNATLKKATLEDDFVIANLSSGSLDIRLKDSDVSHFVSRHNAYGIQSSLEHDYGNVKTYTPYIYLEEEDYGDRTDRYGYFALGSIVNGTSQGDKIKMYGRTGNITCVSLTQTSKAEKKKNFEKLENAIDILKDVDIYKYNMIDEKDTDKKHVGFVIGENFKYRKEITSSNNEEAEIYSMVSVLWKAVQEQQKEIEELRKLVNK